MLDNEVEAQILSFQERYEEIYKPFEWRSPATAYQDSRQNFIANSDYSGCALQTTENTRRNL